MKKTAVTFALQISAMLGNKEAQSAVRMDIINAAILTAVKGNSTPWIDGMAVAAKGKGKIADALMAGFHAVGMIPVFIKPQDPMGKDDRAEKNAEEADRLTAVFFGAFDASMPKEKTKEEKEADKAEREAAKATALAEAVEKEISARGLVSADKLASDGDIINAALALLIAGKVGDALAEEFRAALGVPSMLAQSFADGKAAGLAEAAEAQAAAAIASASAAPAPKATKRTAKKADTATA
jgi:hypothetical protein